MENLPPKIWEDGKYVYIPEELFGHLPPEFREAADSAKQIGDRVLPIADNDLQSLVRLSKAILTSTSLSYIYHRLRNANFDFTLKAVMEQEMLTTAFVVSYSRLFTSSTGTKGISKDQIPPHLKSFHEEILDIRNKRYAHNGDHETTDSGLQVSFDELGFHVDMQFSFGFCVGGRNEWEELIAFVDAHMHETLYKILARLKKRTGYDWNTSSGPAPDWLGKY